MSNVSASASPSRSVKTIHVAVPEKIGNNLESMQKVTAAVLGRLGCPTCHSGIDIRFHQLEENAFVVNEHGQIQ